MRSHPDPPHEVAAAFFANLATALTLVPLDHLARAVRALEDARARRRRVYVIGNGGSAATASHLVCDLVKATPAGAEPLRAIALADNGPLVTALANDAGYDRVFAAQLAGLLDRGDVVVAISASGRSPNVLAGLRAARRAGARTVGLLGFDGGPALALADVALHVPCHDYGTVETAHLAIAHALAAALRTAARTRPAVAAAGGLGG